MRPQSSDLYCSDGPSGRYLHQHHRWLYRWFWGNTLLSGVFAGLWLVWRSGTKPSRLTYPCQQAAVGTMTAAFGAPLVATFLALRRRIIAARASQLGRIFAVGIILATLTLSVQVLSTDSAPGLKPLPIRQAPLDYRAQVYVIDSAQGPAGQHFGGLDDLIVWMGLHGLKLYQSNSIMSFEAGPAGVISANDVVVLKINYQWDQRGGTNVDLLRGLIRRIIDHPDGFSGEVVVCENAQFNPVSNFDRANNNGEVYGLSPHDVVVEYQNESRPVTHFDWTAIRNTAVAEYSAGDVSDGYIVQAYDPVLLGRISYPKFRTSYGTYVSLKHGVWNPAGGAYNRSRLKFINMPVLKSHHSTYGVTACVKHYMGVVTGVQSTNSHSAIGYGILGALLGEIHLADLNILDCIWINANPYSGPSTSYAGATRVDKLVAGVDPVAIDMWAAKNILIPAFVANGYSPPWPAPSADPDNPGSAFRVYLDNSMNRILAAGYNVTNDLSRINALRWNGETGMVGDVNGDGIVNSADVGPFVDVLLGDNADVYRVLRSDVDEDHDVDDDDALRLVTMLVSS